MRARPLILCVLALASVGVFAAPTPPAVYPDREFDAGLGRLADLAFSSDGRLLAAAGAKGYGVWDAQSGTSIRTGSLGSAARVALGAQGTYLAVGGDDGKVSVVDLRSGMSRDVAKHGKPVTAVSFSADGKIGASGDAAGNINLWDPERGPIGPLNNGGHKDAILVLSFSPAGSLLSVSKDLRVVTWDVPGKRPQRRSSMASEVSGRTLVPSTAATDSDGIKLVLGAQLISTPRGGVLAGGSAFARPEDLRRDNVLMPYVVATGVATDAVKSGDFQAEHLALSPGGCFAFFSSNARGSQPRLHVWGLVEQGDDLTRTDLPAEAVAVALEPGGHEAAVAFQAGRIKTFKVSGATSADCDAYAKKSGPPQAGPKITLGSETDPLIKSGSGMRIAVLRFEATGIDAGLGDAVAQMVADELSNNKDITVVERGAIDSILKEMEIQRSGLTTADAVKIGKGLNARKVLLGGVRRFGESTYLTSARIVDVETQQVEGSREVTCENCKTDDLPAAVKVLRRAIVP